MSGVAEEKSWNRVRKNIILVSGLQELIFY